MGYHDKKQARGRNGYKEFKGSESEFDAEMAMEICIRGRTYVEEVIRKKYGHFHGLDERKSFRTPSLGERKDSMTA